MFKMQDMEKEIWKDIPGYDGYYQVSSLGRVKSLDRLVTHWRGGKKIIKGIILKSCINSSGYVSCALAKDGSASSFTVHKLVAMAFLNHKPCGYHMVVDHIDNDKKNNRLDNLQVITQRQNCSKDKSRGSSKYVGVYWHKPTNKWQSKIWINGKTKHIGLFDNEIDAYNAYTQKLKQHDTRIKKIKS